MSLDVSLKIGSQIGFRRPSTQTLAFAVGQTGVGGINAPRPVVTTLLTLDGQVNAEPPFEGTRIVTVSSTTDFIMYPGQTSTSQTINITNEGSLPLSLQFPYIFPSQDGATFNFVNFSPNNGLLPEPIDPGTTGTLTISYTAGQAPGEYYNWFVIFTNADNPQYKVVTKQIISEQFNARIDPLSYSTTTNTVGERAYVSYILTPVINSIDRPDIEVEYLYSLTTGTGWKVLSTTTNAITLEFESNDIRNINNTYEAVLSITAAGATVNLPNIANVAIDPDKNYNLLQWQSPIAPHNSVIGVSYDVIAGEKTLTIAVGAGGDGSPDYDAGGDGYISMRNITLGGDNMDNPYVFWAEAYRFKNLGTGTARTYLSGQQDADGVYLYQDKFTEGRNYSYYFGTERSVGSMFIVEDDGQGNLIININSLREYSDDEDFNVTLDNLTRAFHYYSERDQGGRIKNLIQYPFVAAIDPPTLPNTTATVTPPGETRTNLFRGFTYVDKMPSRTTVGTASSGTSLLTLNTTTGLVAGDIIKSIGTSDVEGKLIGIASLSTNSNVITLTEGLPFTVSSSTTVVFKNPVRPNTSLVGIPR